MGQLQTVAAANADAGRGPFADAVERQNRGLVKRRGKERAGGVRLVMIGEDEAALVTGQFAACRRSRRNRGGPLSNSLRQDNTRWHRGEIRGRACTRKPFFLSRCHDAPVDYQGGGRVMVKGGNAENRGHARLPSVLKIVPASFRRRQYCATTQGAMPSPLREQSRLHFSGPLPHYSLRPLVRPEKLALRHSC